MNDLQQLLTVRDISLRDLAAAIGYGYHSVQKAVKGTRPNLLIMEAIAVYLDLSYDQVWGDQAPLTLRRLIRQELRNRQTSLAGSLPGRRASINV